VRSGESARIERSPSLPKDDRVLAVVVSYNGRAKTRLAVDALRGQVSDIYIVDNGSDAETLDVLAALEEEGGVSVARLGENKGVGYALNLGVERARELGYGWLLTMDQDSVVDAGLMAAYRAAIAVDRDRLCLTPSLVDSGWSEGAASASVSYAITSGNLVRLDVFDRIGPYDEGFFVDCIDFDFCLRLRRAGGTVRRVHDARMRHRLGETARVPVAVRRFYVLHAPTRRYYMYRNYCYLAERYLLRFPGFIVKLGLLQLLLMVLIGFLDPRPMESFRAVGKGLADYLGRRRGPYPEAGR